jgi:glycosyltransferase involved in cell wall biosynthesis
MLDLLVISHACFTAINRSVYHLFVKDGWKVEIVIPRNLKFPSGIREADPPKLDDPPLHYLKLIGNNPRIYSFEGLSALLDQKRPRIILLDNDPASVLALQLGWWCKKKNSWLFCISCENLPLDLRSTYARKGIKGLPAGMLKRGLLGGTRKLVDGVFTINQDGEKLFREEGFVNVIHMPLGFDPAYFYPDETIRPLIRAKWNLTQPVIAYFGRITPEKGVHLLIQALRDLKEFPWQLMMDAFDEFASGYNAEISNLIREAGIMDRTVFISPSHFEISSYMNAADIVVVPSVTTPGWKEQYGRVAAEALGCGKKVIASNSGALPELLQQYGHLFEEGNVGALKDLLKKMLSNREPAPVHTVREVAEYALNTLSIHRQKAVMEAAFQ